MPRYWLHITCYALFLVFLAGCCTIQPPEQAVTPQEAPKGFKTGDIVDTQSGKVISFARLMNVLSGVSIVYVGETHTSAQDHRIQQRIAKALYARNPQLILAMEMFPRDTQPVLDRYSSGQLPEQQFLKAVDWQQVWGYPFELYRGILTWARQKHLKIVGLNIPPQIAHKISQDGLSSLTPAERSQVAAHLNFDNLQHRQYIQEEFEHHPKVDIKDFKTFYEAQLAWEETMAETLAQTLATAKQGTSILVLIGNGHINYRFGVPQRAWERTHQPYKSIMPVPANFIDGMIDPKVADYVWITAKLQPFHHGRLGIMIQSLPSRQGLTVLQVIPGSLADKAGIKQNDVLTNIDGAPVKTLEDVHQAVAAHKGSHHLQLKRGTKDISMTIAPKTTNP